VPVTFFAHHDCAFAVSFSTRQKRLDPMSESFFQKRHVAPAPLDRPRELIVACPPMRSNVNLSRIARAAGCFGVRRLICCGTARLTAKIARDATEQLALEVHRTLPPVLKRLREEGYQLVGLEQTTDSHCLYDFAFQRGTVLVIGKEREGIEEELLGLVDCTVEIPSYGLPHAHNAATATAIAMYEYCRQFPRG
jgi:tRNA G18 (ribose-2'-O)-methylase SpoU